MSWLQGLQGLEVSQLEEGVVLCSAELQPEQGDNAELDMRLSAWRGPAVPCLEEGMASWCP